jgi:uncharacterized protein (TIGR02117 family)
MKRLIKITLRVLFVFLGSIGLYLLCAYILSSLTIEAETIAADEIEIYIITNGVHTDIVVPVKTEHIYWDDYVKHEHTRAADSTHQYLALGWGDKGFYLETPTWSDLKASVAFKAAFGLSTTAIHATYYEQMNESETCKRIMISREQYGRLVQYIKSTFQFDGNGNLMPIATNANYGNTDAFYEAKGSYSLFSTCNTWSNNALKVSGQKCCVWTAFDTGIFKKYDK